MTSTRHTSFASLDEAAFSTYVSDLLDRHHGDAERQRNVAYVQTTLAKDEAAIVADRSALWFFAGGLHNNSEPPLRR